MIKPEDVTIIIPHLGGSPEAEYALNECIKSLMETTPQIKRIVSLNGEKCSSDEHLDFNEKPFKQITIEDQGQCKAVNAAAATVNTPWIFVTNDDMVYAPGWFEKLVFTANGEEMPVGCVSPQLVEPRLGAPTFLVEFCGGAGGDFDKNKWLKFAEWHNKEVGYSRDLRTGFNLPFLISKELWDTVGGYDINYDPWGSNSDSDLEYKIKLAGVQPYQNTNCLVYHFSQTSGTFHPDNQGAWQKNWDYFIQKWGFPRTDIGIWEANFKIPTVGEGRVYTPKWEGKYESNY